MNYNPSVEEPTPPGQGRIARYARGPDYHDVLRNRLKELLSWLQIERPDCRGRAVVDTAPLLERDFARRAGLGWIGKNTMLLHPRLGSYFFLGALLVDEELTPDQPFVDRHIAEPALPVSMPAPPTPFLARAGSMPVAASAT